MAYATRAYKRDNRNTEVCKGQLIFQCASNESMLPCFYNWGQIKLQSFENWLQLSIVENQTHFRAVEKAKKLPDLWWFIHI